MATQRPETRALFLDELNEAYKLRRKSLLLLTGDVHGHAPASDDFVSLEARATASDSAVELGEEALELAAELPGRLGMGVDAAGLEDLELGAR